MNNRLHEMPSNLVRVGLRTAEIVGRGDAIKSAREVFHQQHALTLPDFLAPDALAYVQHMIERDGFQLRVHDALPSKPSDLLLNPSIATGVLMLALNDARFLDFARQVSQRADIKSLRGSITRRMPGGGHGDAWHNDMVDD